MLNGKIQYAIARLFIGVAVVLSVPVVAQAASLPTVTVRYDDDKPVPPLERPAAAAAMVNELRSQMPPGSDPEAVDIMLSVYGRCLTLALLKNLSPAAARVACAKFTAVIVDPEHPDHETALELVNDNKDDDAGGDAAGPPSNPITTNHQAEPYQNDVVNPTNAITTNVQPETYQNNGTAGDATNGSNQPKDDDKKDKDNNSGGGSGHHTP